MPRKPRPRIRTSAILALALGLLVAAPAQAGDAPTLTDTPLAEVDRRITEIDRLLVRAHFRTALALCRSTLERLPGEDFTAAEGVRRARLEVMVATAQVALGERSAARRSLERALAADPTLIFEERELSPKLLELVPRKRRAAAVEVRP